LVEGSVHQSDGARWCIVFAVGLGFFVPITGINAIACGRGGLLLTSVAQAAFATLLPPHYADRWITSANEETTT